MKRLILTLILLRSILSLTSNEICLRGKVFQGNYNQDNKYDTVETTVKCANTLNQQECGPDHCALNKVYFKCFFFKNSN